MTPFATIPPTLARLILRNLDKALPPPPDDTQEDREIRDLAAMASIARLAPMNAAEAQLAADVIAAEAHARDAIQSAVQHRNDPAREARCRAQSALMTRQAAQIQKALRLMQAERRKAELWHEAEMAASAQAAGQADAHGSTDEQSQGVKQNPIERSHETNMAQRRRPWTQGAPTLSAFASLAPSGRADRDLPPPKPAVHAAA